MIFSPYELHRTSDLTKNSKNYYVLYFDNTWLKQFLPIKIEKNILDDEKLTKILLNISKRVLNDEIITEVELTGFFKKLTSKYILENKNVEEQNLFILDIKNYIIDNLEFTPTLEDISKNFGLSKEHIIRIFKKELGLTPHAFIINCKINQAKEIISNTKFKAISDVAYESGFYDQSHFSKSFKRIFAINPSEVLN